MRPSPVEREVPSPEGMVSCIFEPCTNRVLKIKAFATPVLAAVSYHSYLLYSSLQLEVSSFCLLVLNMPWGRMSSISKLRLSKQESRRSVHPPTSPNICSFGGFAPYYTNRKKNCWKSSSAAWKKSHSPAGTFGAVAHDTGVEAFTVRVTWVPEAKQM